MVFAKKNAEVILRKGFMHIILRPIMLPITSQFPEILNDIKNNA